MELNLPQQNNLDMEDLILRIKVFLNNEARSCSMDFGCITPLYVYRMWGGAVDFEIIEASLKEIRNDCR